MSRVCSAMVRMNRQESAEGDVVKREDGVARAFRVQPIPAIEVSGYIWIFRTSRRSLANRILAFDALMAFNISGICTFQSAVQEFSLAI